MGKLSMCVLFADASSLRRLKPESPAQFVCVNATTEAETPAGAGAERGWKMSGGAGIDYSVWDHIYVSDDEDVTSPYVDTPSLFRMRHRVSSDTSSREVWSLVPG